MVNETDQNFMAGQRNIFQVFDPELPGSDSDFALDEDLAAQQTDSSNSESDSGDYEQPSTSIAADRADTRARSRSLD